MMESRYSLISSFPGNLACNVLLEECSEAFNGTRTAVRRDEARIIGTSGGAAAIERRRVDGGQRLIKVQAVHEVRTHIAPRPAE